MPVDGLPISAGGDAIAGIYATYADLVAEVNGQVNLDTYADGNGDGNQVYIGGEIQDALTAADSEINTDLQLNQLATPATVNLPMLKLIARKIAAFQIYQTRGLADSDKAIGGKFKGKYDWAKAKLEELTFNNKGGFTPAAGSTNALGGYDGSYPGACPPVSRLPDFSPRYPFIGGCARGW